jgi:hypothetical protein
MKLIYTFSILVLTCCTLFQVSFGLGAKNETKGLDLNGEFCKACGGSYCPIEHGGNNCATVSGYEGFCNCGRTPIGNVTTMESGCKTDCGSLYKSTSCKDLKCQCTCSKSSTSGANTNTNTRIGLLYSGGFVISVLIINYFKF